MSSPAYATISQEKPPSCGNKQEEQADEANWIDEPTTSPLVGTCVRTLLYSSALLLAVAACSLVGMVIAPGLADCVKSGSTRAWAGSRVVTVTQHGTIGEKGTWKWWNKRNDLEVRGDDEQYSTSTLRDGSTQTFVFTTRPIVNPGGYTIGTLTGYVPVSSTTQDVGPTTTVGATATRAASQELSSSARSASTIPLSAGSTSATGVVTQSSTLPLSHLESWSRVSTTASSPSITSTSKASSPAERAIVPEEFQDFDFGEVDYHLRHRRGLNFESTPDADQGSSQNYAPSSMITSLPDSMTTGSMTGVEEYSTSTARNGDTYTLVKTTRPIVNPGGYTIGTLDGGWVDVNKIKPTPTSAKRSTHEELKKREVVNLQA